MTSSKQKIVITIEKADVAEFMQLLAEMLSESDLDFNIGI